MLKATFGNENAAILYERAYIWARERNARSTTYISVKPRFMTVNRLQNEARPYAVIKAQGMNSVKAGLTLTDPKHFEKQLRLFEEVLTFQEMLADTLRESVESGKDIPEVNEGHLRIVVRKLEARIEKLKDA